MTKVLIEGVDFRNKEVKPYKIHGITKCGYLYAPKDWVGKKVSIVLME